MRSQTRDDRILPITRAVAALVIVILLMAVYVLYLHPDQTAQMFAWNVQPRMTPLMMGAGYLMGAYFFVRVLTGTRWHRVAAGFIPITAFTWFMGFATLLHLDRFTFPQWPAWLWSIVYIVTPLLVPFLWWLNGKTDPGTPEPDDRTVPLLQRRLALAVGILLAIAALVMFLVPSLAISLWPWKLTPLTARVLGGWAALPAVGGLVLSRESRWSGWRVLIQAACVGLAFYLLAIVLAWSDWNPSNLLTPLFIAGAAAVLLLLLVYYSIQEMRVRIPARE